MKFTLPSIYPITDTRISGISHAAQVERLIAGGATLIQLREKHASPAQFLAEAKKAVNIARDHGVTIIINDRVDIALAVKADGVHLGQDDLPPAAARKLLGPEAIIGCSTHSVVQAIAAIKLPIDYIAIGPAFETTTKEDPDDVVGLGGLRRVRDAIGDFPLVAIGGITEVNLSSVFATGVDSAAMIGELVFDADDISQRYARLARLRPQP